MVKECGGLVVCGHEGEREKEWSDGKKRQEEGGQRRREGEGGG